MLEEIMPGGTWYLPLRAFQFFVVNYNEKFFGQLDVYLTATLEPIPLSRHGWNGWRRVLENLLCIRIDSADVSYAVNCIFRRLYNLPHTVLVDHDLPIGLNGAPATLLILLKAVNAATQDI